MVGQALKQVLRRMYAASRTRVSGTMIDRRRGIETSAKVRLDDLELAHADRVGYEPSAWRTLRRILPESEVGGDDAFLDLGSGKGRVVLEAAHYSFSRVIGVELSTALHERARKNVEAARGSLCCEDVELVCADARTYEVPDDVTVVFLYNPFRGPTFQQVVDRLLASVDRRPRPLRIIYRTPLEHDRIVAGGRFRMEREIKGLRPTREWSRTSSIRMYVAEPAGVAP